MNCSVEGCECRGETSADAFCEAHWRALPRWARVELVKLRNAARRGNQARVREYLQASAVAVHLVALNGRSTCEDDAEG
jgi:hypothetical protein